MNQGEIQPVEELDHAKRQVSIWCDVPDDRHWPIYEVVIGHDIIAEVGADVRGVLLSAEHKIIRHDAHPFSLFGMTS